MSRVLVPLAEGFEEIEAVSIIDVLRRGDIEVVVGSLSSELAVKGAHGLVISADMDVNSISVDSLDMIVLPGGWGGTKALAADETIQNMLKTMDKEGKNIGAICAAPYALNRAGVLKNSYTCYPSVEKEINKKGYQGESAMVVQDENIMTSRGPATALCFGLEIVKKLKGEEMYKTVKEGLIATYCE